MKINRCYCPHCQTEGPALGKGLIWNCTKCGTQTKPPKVEMQAFWIALGVVAVGIAICSGMIWQSKNAQRERVAKALAYLETLDEVAWHRIDNGQVTIGFREPIPKDWSEIVRAAALHGNRAIGTSFNAWAVPEAEGDRILGGAEAQGGKITRE